MGYRINIDCEIWTDEKFSSLSLFERNVWFFLLANPYFRSNVGIFRIDPFMVAHALKCDATPEDVEKALGTLEEKGMILRSKKSGEIAVLNYLRYQYGGRTGRPAYDTIAEAECKVKDPSLLRKTYEHLNSFADNPYVLQSILKRYFAQNGGIKA